MPREAKNKRVTYNTPGDAHELTFSVYRRKKLMLEEGIVEFFLNNLLAASKQMKFDIWAYVVMPDHVHILLWPREEVYDMAEIRTRIKKPVAERAFELHPEWRKRMTVKVSGKPVTRFWQKGAGYDRNLFSPSVILASIDYIHNNPVRKGLVEAATEWVWSSARNYAGLKGEIPVVFYEPPHYT